MSFERMMLVNQVWKWEAEATRRGDIPRRKDCWRIIDALMGDLPSYRKPAFRDSALTALGRMNDTPVTRLVRKAIEEPEG